MKNLFIIIGLFLLNIANAQYFQQRFNLDYVTPKFRSERDNSGIRTRDNYMAANPLLHYYAGIGTSFNNIALPAPDNVADRMRFQLINNTGVAVVVNNGYQFADAAAAPAFHSYGNSIAEVKNATNTGGFVTVGSVENNTITGANAIVGGSDALFTRLDLGGAVISAKRYDINGGKDKAWCIRKSAVLVNGQPTWILCGESKTSANNTDCFVARVYVNGTPVWFNRYNFDPTAGMFNSAHNIAKQLCEDPAGNIFGVGTLQDGFAGASIDGLAFKLSPAGVVIWASDYNTASDDEFQAVRFTADGNLIIGGFTNFGVAPPVTHNMLITKLTSVGGVIMFQNILRATAGATNYTSKCYDIIETINGGMPQYFLAGSLTTGAGNFEMMYRAGPAGVGINWYRYNKMNYTTGFGLDDVNTPALAGVAYFSSMKNPGNGGVSDSHIMKTDYTGRTCNFCQARPPFTFALQMEKHNRQWLQLPTGQPTKLVSTVFAYSDGLICNQPVVACGDAPAAISGKQVEASSSNLRAGTINVFPNPVSNLLHIQFNDLPVGEYEVTLSDMEGRVLLQKNTGTINDKSFMDINLSSVSRGLYLLKVKRGSFLLKQKVVKQ